MNTYNRRTVISLYRAKLRVCNDLGYSLGKWNDDNLARRQNLHFNKMMKSKTKRNIGAYIMDNFRFRYKLYKEEDNDNTINLLIDDGFNHLRKLNKLHYIKKEEQLIGLIY